MQKKLIRVFIFVLLTAFLVNCSGAQPEAVQTAKSTVIPEVEKQIPEKTGTHVETPEETQTAESAACDLPLPGPEDWEIVLCETFDDNLKAWEVESQDNEYARYTSAIADGKFVVDYTAKGFAAFQRTALTWFTIGNEKNFALSVTGLMESAFQDASWGVAFRGNGDSFFLFSIRNNGSYAFEIFENGGWTPLISPKNYNGIRPGEENTLRIEADGQDFYFSINDEMVNQFNGGLLEGTQVLLVVSAKEGVSANFTFDDVILQK